jgi:heme A synthase
VAILIVIMIIVGGLTRLTESGLSMVDWKLIGGELLLNTNVNREFIVITLQKTEEILLNV